MTQDISWVGRQAFVKFKSTKITPQINLKIAFTDSRLGAFFTDEAKKIRLNFFSLSRISKYFSYVEEYCASGDWDFPDLLRGVEF